MQMSVTTVGKSFSCGEQVFVKQPSSFDCTSPWIHRIFIICTFTLSFWLLDTSQQRFIVLEQERERERERWFWWRPAESSLPQRLFHSDPVTPPHSYSYSPTLEGASYSRCYKKQPVWLSAFYTIMITLSCTEDPISCQPAIVSLLTGGVDG
jgi:hypothetical protein